MVETGQMDPVCKVSAGKVNAWPVIVHLDSINLYSNPSLYNTNKLPYWKITRLW